MEPETELSLSARISSWLRRLRETLISFWVAVFSWFSKLRAPIQKAWNAIRPQDSTNDERTDSQDERPDTVPPKPNSPPPPTNKKESRKRCRSGLQIAIFVVEVLALFGLGVYAYLTYLMYCETKKAANAAKRSADTAASQLELAERPWVKAEISINGPFDFNVNGANIHLKFRLLNTGHSPALTTVIEALPVDSYFTGIADPAQYRDQVCRHANDVIQRYPDHGVALFPNSPFEQGGTWTFAEISKNHGNGSKIPGFIVWPSVVVCIGYRPPFNQTSIYHTSYIFDFIKVDGSNRPSVDFKIGEDVERDRLRLQCHHVNCITAD